MGSAFNASLTDAVLYSHVYSQRVDTTRDESGRAGTTDAVNVREHSKMRALPKPDSHLENRCGPKPTVVEATTSVLALELGVGAFDRNGDDDRVVFAANGEVGHVSAFPLRAVHPRGVPSPPAAPHSSKSTSTRKLAAVRSA